MPPFHFPFLYNYKFYNKNNIKHSYNINQIQKTTSKKNYSPEKETFTCNTPNSSNIDIEDFFIELFGLKLHFDDILLICLIFFLYNEKIADDELFISLLLLLLS